MTCSTQKFMVAIAAVAAILGGWSPAIAQETPAPAADAQDGGVAASWAAVQDLWRTIDAMVQKTQSPQAALAPADDAMPPEGFEAIDDAYLALMAKAHAVMSALPEGDAEAAALKTVLQARLWGVTRGRMDGGSDLVMAGVVRARVVVMRNGMAQKVEVEDKDPSQTVKEFESAIDPRMGTAEGELREKLKRSLDDMQVFPEGGAPWRLNRAVSIVEALSRGGAYPARPQASPESLAEVAKCIGDLGSADFGVRDAATSRLQELGEVAVPALREALQSEDPEVRARASQILGED